MPVLQFPSPQDADENGVVAWGGDLHPDTLRLAYRQGIFPWPHEGLPLLWFCPDPRAILPFDRLHIPASLARNRRRLLEQGYTVSIDRAFHGVVRGCRNAFRPGQSGTWITPEIERAYGRLHRDNGAHSAETWDAGGNLVGGVYGVDEGGTFCGESMFFTRPYASKLALLHLIEHLQSRGAEWMDIQMMTPHMQALGAIEVSRDDFLARLEAAQARGLQLFP